MKPASQWAVWYGHLMAAFGLPLLPREARKPEIMFGYERQSLYARSGLTLPNAARRAPR